MEQTLGKRIVQHRKRLRLTQDQLAEKLGVTAQAVSKWENDQSCPDITMLPRLAEIFDTTTDALLGREKARVCDAEVVEEKEEKDGFRVCNGNFELSFDGGRKAALKSAISVLGFGIVLMISRIFHQEVSFWRILWPWTLAIWGFFGILDRFSFFNIGLFLFGTYFLLDNTSLLPFSIGAEFVFPLVIVMLGISLLADALKKPKKPRWRFREPSGKGKNHVDVEGESFGCTGSFGEYNQCIHMPRLSEGSIAVSFGNFVVDLSGVESVAPDCAISANSSFGELTVRVPRRFEAVLDNSTSFAQIQISGHPREQTEGQIHIDAHASFGEILIQYVD